MSEQDILKAARECDTEPVPIENCTYHFTKKELITFARRIAAMQREIDAGILEANARQCFPDGYLREVLDSNVRAIRGQSDE